MKKYYKIFIILLIVVFILPQIVFAAWWNPFSWSVWENIRSIFVVNQIQEVEQKKEVSEEKSEADETNLEVEEKPVQELLAENSQANTTGKTNNEAEKLRKQAEEQKRQNEIERQIEEAGRLKKEAEELAEEQKKQEDKVKQLELAEQEKPKNKYPEIKTLVDFYWENPTIANFEEFCKRSKNVLSPETKRVLNNTRTEMIDVNKTLYETIGSCQIYLEKKQYYDFVKSDLTHKIDFRDSDTDKERELRIKYNQKIEEIAENYNFFGYMFSSSFMIYGGRSGALGPAGHLNVCLTWRRGWGLSSRGAPSNYSPNCEAFISGLVVPEEQLRQLQKYYE